MRYPYMFEPNSSQYFAHLLTENHPKLSGWSFSRYNHQSCANSFQLSCIFISPNSKAIYLFSVHDYYNTDSNLFTPLITLNKWTGTCVIGKFLIEISGIIFLDYHHQLVTTNKISRSISKYGTVKLFFNYSSMILYSC